MREYDKGANSGTMFYQIANDCKRDGIKFDYNVIGIQRFSNTKRLFDRAKSFGVTYYLAEDILKLKPDAVFLSNGPGDPKDVPEVIEMVKAIVGKKPLIGVCMGNQLINLALGGDTKKMKFGHHGGNHPVKDLKTGRVYITSQNHEYVVCDLPEGVEAAFVNINDDTIEGIRHKTLPIFSVQFHPEACPGPLDSGFLFDRFLEVIERGSENA